MGCGLLKALAISPLVMAAKMTRLASLEEMPSSWARCQAMASPSRSKSVANQTCPPVEVASLAARFRSLMTFSLPSRIW